MCLPYTVRVNYIICFVTHVSVFCSCLFHTNDVKTKEKKPDVCIFVLKFCQCKDVLLTFKSLNGCIKMPNGSLDFCNNALLSGIFVSVHLKIL